MTTVQQNIREHKAAFDMIARARADMVQSQRFFGFLAMTLTAVVDETIETMETDGKSVFFSPDFVVGLKRDHLIFVLAHEVCHVALLHHVRRRGRDPYEWNICCDYAVNAILKKAGFKMPEGALYDPQYEGMSAEAIFRKRAQERQQQQQQQQPEEDDDQQSGAGGDDEKDDTDGDDDQTGDETGDDEEQERESEEGEPQEDGDEPQQAEPKKSLDPGRCGGVRDPVKEDGSEASPADLKEAEADTMVNVAQANSLCNAAGQGTEETKRIAETVMKSQIDWIEELRRFMTKAAREETDWSRPNRRLAGQGIYMPSNRSTAMGPIVVALDASYSTSAWLDRFTAEIKAVVEDLVAAHRAPEKIIVLHTTDRVVAVEEYEPEAFPEKIEIKGIGGTDFRPAFAEVENLGLEPACLIYLTDLYGTYPKYEPGYPVLWACCSPEVPAWGDVIELKE
jgi:predicted metal-dependent peptidase